MAEYWRHKEDPDVIIRVLRDVDGTISVSGDDPDSTVFHLTRAELTFNFEPLSEGPDSESRDPEQETKT